MNVVLIALYASLVVTIASSFVPHRNLSIPYHDRSQTVSARSASAAKSLGFFELILSFIQTGLSMMFGSDNKPITGRRGGGGKVSYKGFHVIRVFPKDDDEVEELENIQDDVEYIQFWSKPMKKMPLDILVPPESIADTTAFLRGKEIDYETLMYDVQKLITYENPKMTKDQRDVLLGRQGHPFTWSRYHRYADMIRYLEFLVYSYPQLVELITIGYTTNGLPIRVVKVSAASSEEDSGDTKPAVWIDGGMHGREWITPSVALYILRQLVEKFTKNKRLVESADWYILPVANPDGYEYTHTADRLWSKTRSNHDNSASIMGTSLESIYGACEGVNLDQNFDFHWGELGTSDDPCSDFYAGPRAYSEPESKAIADFLTDKRGHVELAISLRSYAQKMLIPWSYTKKKAENHDEMMSLAKKAAQYIKNMSAVEYDVGKTSNFEPLSSGSFTDWVKSTANVKHTYTIKLRDAGTYGFLLPATQILPTAKETFAAVKIIAKSVVCKS